MDLVKIVRALGDRVGATILAVLGALALLLGWIGVSRTGYVTEQMPYIISGGMVGIFLLGAGGVLWLSADLRDDWRKLDALDETMTRLDETLRTRSTAGADAPTGELPAVTVEKPVRARKATTSRGRSS